MFLFDKLVVWTLPLVPKPIVGYFSKTYISGPNLEDAVRVIKNLNAKGMMATMDLLGEESKDRNEAQKAVDEYKRALITIDEEKLDSNVSVKPTQMGLLIDPEFCYQNIRSIIEVAQNYNNFVRIDMEDRHCTTDTIKMYLRLKEVMFYFNDFFSMLRTVKAGQDKKK